MQVLLPGALALIVGTLFLARIGDTRAQPAAPADAPADAGTTLVHRFTLPAGPASHKVSVSLSTRAWHVGHADGPVASAAQMRLVLGRLAGVEIGARCAGWVDGRTEYPCGFAISEVGLAGSPAEARFSAMAYDMGSRAGSPGTDSPALRASGLTGPVRDDARLVTVKVPPRFVVGAQAAVSDGSTLTWHIRALSNPQFPSRVERDSGTVILRGSGEGEIKAEVPAPRGVI